MGNTYQRVNDKYFDGSRITFRNWCSMQIASKHAEPFESILNTIPVRVCLIRNCLWCSLRIKTGKYC